MFGAVDGAVYARVAAVQPPRAQRAFAAGRIRRMCVSEPAAVRITGIHDTYTGANSAAPPPDRAAIFSAAAAPAGLRLGVAASGTLRGGLAPVGAGSWRGAGSINILYIP